MNLKSALKNPKIEIQEFEIIGLSPLLVQNWASRFNKPIVCCYGRKPRSSKERLFESFLDSLYIIDRKKVPRRPIGPGESWPFIKGAFGIPLGMFRKPLFSTARLLAAVSRAGHSPFMFDEGIVPIRYSRLICQATPIRIGPFRMGPLRGLPKVCDVRIRGKFEGWSVRIKIRFDANRVSTGGVLAVLRAAGNFSGIGTCRPEMGGDHGRFTAEPVMKSV